MVLLLLWRKITIVGAVWLGMCDPERHAEHTQAGDVISSPIFGLHALHGQQRMSP